MALSILEALPSDSRGLVPASRSPQQARTEFSRVFDAARAGAAESDDIAAPQTAATDRQAPLAAATSREPAQQPSAEGREDAAAGDPPAAQAQRPPARPADGKAETDDARKPGAATGTAGTGKPPEADRPAVAQAKERRAAAAPKQVAAEGGSGPRARLAAAAAGAPKSAEGEAAGPRAVRPPGARDAEKAAASGQAPRAEERVPRAAAESRTRPHAGERVLTAAELVAAVAARHQAPQPAGVPKAAGDPEKKIEGPRREGQAEPRVVVIDLRKQPPPQPAKEKAPAPAEAAERAGRTARDGDRDGRGLGVSLFKADRNAEAPAAAAAPQAAGRFRDALQAELVRHSTMVLRDDGATSEMRLVLKPESLGAVRIHLKMADNHIEGQIVVDNKNVRQLFESVLPSLEDGLRQQGFGSASLQVSVGHRDATAGRDRPEPARAAAGGAIEARASAADRWAVLRLGDGLVDLIV